MRNNGQIIVLNGAVNPTLHAAEFRRCLDDLDVDAARRLWAHVMPHLAQPQSNSEALATLHYARTQAQSTAQRKRFYSHRWLLDHGFPSGLPDHLRPWAERMYPAVVEGTGIAVGARDGDQARADAVRSAMERALLECQADGERNSDVLRARMMEARVRVLRG